jgi:hypothetical protein
MDRLGLAGGCVSHSTLSPLLSCVALVPSLVLEINGCEPFVVAEAPESK